MVYVSTMDKATGFMPPMGDQAIGTELTQTYNEGSPFPHIVIDDFLPPEVLETVLAHCDDLQMNEDAFEFDRAQERFKRSYQPDSLPDPLRTLFYSFNSRPFIKMLENITGIKGLIPDPYFLGAGIHEIRQGGHLSVHADFNHHKIMNLERRINVLIYLNKDWKADYGGSLELWDEAMTTREQDVVPEFNRCVIFNTTSNSQHGNPQPINHPAGISRKSIALYYYTSTWDGTKRAHTTQFQVRPKSGDERDWRTRVDELRDDLLPPFIARLVKRVF
ncbi:2OG-Fe(II) oxygenase [Sphingomonas aliaeris]|uniref:2OG-Fe(II) oxygenase n=1 Tax=Sphingomonas aliaeris TaxID=2759526 RepID=A0A974NVZ8_9SPHN|nr:2OG-Fe(II) oxygenase [Sphingomonas aliaeris]QQV78079.1 2OG-Fe(II) oxygenase [Sphingomonas aliaeris]